MQKKGERCCVRSTNIIFMGCGSCFRNRVLRKKRLKMHMNWQKYFETISFPKFTENHIPWTTLPFLSPQMRSVHLDYTKPPSLAKTMVGVSSLWNTPLSNGTCIKAACCKLWVDIPNVFRKKFLMAWAVEQVAKVVDSPSLKIFERLDRNLLEMFYDWLLQLGHWTRWPGR